jgi:hypothetical protein
MLLPLLLAFQMAPQQASPMVEHTRGHQRVTRLELKGERRTVALGSILMPERPGKSTPLVIHFHGTPWLAEQEVRRAWPQAAVLAVQAGSGSGVYQRAVADPARMQEVIDMKWRRIVLTGWSAGYGAIREILRQPALAAHIDAVILLDGMHADRETMAQDVGPFLDFARAALRGQRRMLVTHSEVFPGTYASTTETADWLVGQLQLRRKAVLKWGPLGMQQLSQAQQKRFRLLGFAGNSAPDHVDHLQALARWVRDIRRATVLGIWGRL